MDLTIDIVGNVQWIRLTREKQRNAISIDMCNELTQLFRAANTDRRVRALVITGSGRDFCTGGEAGVPPSRAADATEDELPPSLIDFRFSTHLFQGLFAALWEIEKPVVSAVNGTVAGVGWSLALLADLVVAADSARWTHVFTKRGMIPHAGDPYFLPRILPFHFLHEIALLSEAVTSEALHRVGAVNRLVPAVEVEGAARELAERLAAGPTRTLGQTKRLYRRSLESDMRTSFNEETMASTLLNTTHDRTEGVRAFMEGRPPRFIGD